MREPSPSDSARLVTFDLFSALIDSRSWGAAALGAIARRHGWDVDAAVLYDRWDAASKASQRDLDSWVPFAEHGRRALTATYADLGLDGDPDDDAAELLDSVGEWPPWPDVVAGLPAIAAAGHRVGVLSNVDDVIFARTRAAALVDDAAVLTSERLHAYKPAPEIYRRARDRAGGDLVHVATSARDVRGALEAGIDVVRLRRPGHRLDPAGPAPRYEAADLTELAAVLDALR